MTSVNNSRTQTIASAMLAEAARPALTVELAPCPGCDLVPQQSLATSWPTICCDGCYDGTEDAGDRSHLCGIAEHRFDFSGAAKAWNEAVAEFIAERTLGPELPGEDSVWEWHEQQAAARRAS